MAKRDRSPVHYEALWRTMLALPDWQPQISQAVNLILSHRINYFLAEKATGVPWAVIGAIHLMEADPPCAMSRGLHCGQRWDQVTTEEPTGKGPFESWQAAAVDALKRWADKTDWDIGRIGARLEAYNGWGYYDRGRESPYLWSGCNWGVGTGKFIADGAKGWRANAVSKQVGAMVVLKELAKRGAWTP